MSFNRKEFLSILMLAKHMATADGELDPVEKKVLIALFNTLKVTAEEQAELKEKGSLEALIKEVTSEEAKNALVDVLALVAGADGDFADEERTFITSVMKRLGMDPSAHAYMKEGGDLDLGKINKNVKAIITNIKDLTS